MIECDVFCDKKKTNKCCLECDEFETCKDACNAETVERCYIRKEAQAAAEQEGTPDTTLAVFQMEQISVINGIVDIVNKKKELEEQEKKLKDALKDAMQKYGIKKFDSEFLSVIFVDESTSTQLDGVKVKKLYPEVAEECQKTVKRSAYVKVTVK